MGISIEPESDPRWTVVQMLLDGEQESVSKLWIVDHQMRVGSVALRMAGVAGVGTREEHRFKGYSRKVITRSVEYMAEDGYDVSMLFGIRNFYPKYGYVATPFDYRVTVPTESAMHARPTLDVRPWMERDLDHIIGIYRLNNSTRSGTVHRPDTWPGFSKGSDFRAKPVVHVVVNHLDEVQGYFVWDETEERTTLSEVGASNPGAWPTIIKAAAEKANSQNHDEISLLMPPDHPLTLACKSYGCSVRLNWPADGGGMMRIINLESTFQKLLPELSGRWRHASVDWQGVLRLTTDLGELCLKLSTTGVEIGHGCDRELSLHIPQTQLTQMLIGYRSTFEVQFDDGVEIPNAALPWLDVLFPSGYPYIWWTDRF